MLYHFGFPCGCSYAVYNPLPFSYEELYARTLVYLEVWSSWRLKRTERERERDGQGRKEESWLERLDLGRRSVEGEG